MRSVAAVHPRVYGEYDDQNPGMGPSSGSSPRVRGIQLHFHFVHSILRFIPACTGNTSTASFKIMQIPVHPRVYGEYSMAGYLVTRQDGSSPRVRGIRQSIFSGDFDTRFIPACTGNTVDCHVQNQRPSVHPRVYGEYAWLYAQKAAEGGSSPRVRGILFPPCRTSLCHRFIPACTGNTLRGSRPAFSRSVHPRVYGEYSSYLFVTMLCSGSSPRVRGILVDDLDDVRPHRFIPACTGNTSPRHR